MVHSLARLALFPALASIAATASAQQTWVVDANGGPGSQFTEIEDAVAAAAAGDVLVIRSGTYFPFTLDKGLTILGQGSPVVVGGCSVTGVPAGPPVVFRDLRIAIGHPSINIGLRFEDNVAAIHLENVGAGQQLYARNCRLLTASTSTMNGGTLSIAFPAVDLVDTNAAFDGCQITGQAGQAIGPALRVTNSLVHLGATPVQGADQFLFAAPGFGIELVSGELTLGAGCSVTAGTLINTPIDAVRTSGGALILDAGVALTPTNGGAAITGPASVSTTTVPAVVSGGALIGGSLNVEIHAPAASFAATFVDVPGTPTATPWGALWLAPQFVLDAGVVPASGSRPVSLSIPPGFPQGVPLTIQALTADAAGIFASTPATLVLHE